MTTETIDTPAGAETGRACAIDAARHMAHFAHEADLIKSIAADAAETGRHAVKRAIARRRRDVEDLRDATVLRVRRAPLLALGAAFAAGVVVAALSAQCVRALRTASAPTDW